MGKSNTKKRFVVLVAIIALIAFIGIGYAAFSQNLNVTGSASLNSDFKVAFENVQETAGADLGSMTISGTNSDTVTITLANLTPGDTYTATVDVKNTGKIDAKYNGITAGAENTAATADVTYSFTVEDGVTTGATLSTSSTDVHTFTFTFSWAKSATEATTTSFTFTYTINYIQA